VNVYLDIGVVHIQSWLTRTPKLRGRRGGSAMITEATSPNSIDDALETLRDEVKRNDEVGDIDGVVPLRLLTSDDEIAKQVELAVVSHLRKQLPTATLSVAKYVGKNYAAAKLNDAEWKHTWSAAVADWPPGRPCDWCHVWPAAPGETDDENNRLCQECVLRRKAAIDVEDGRRETRQERELLDRLGRTAKVPNTLKELAELDGGTHLALIYADGNAIGKFIADLREMESRKAARRLLQGVAQKIDGATWQALITAVETTWDGKSKLPVVPHLVGGDDVLVSVPAGQGWKFVRTLQAEFKQLITRETNGTGVNPPSLSAGVVFHYYAKPLHVMCDLATKLLRSAKEQYLGAEAAIAWQDVTRDGQEPIGRTPFRHSKLEDDHPRLDKLAAIPRAAQQRLAELLRSHELGSGPVEQHLRRLDLAGKVEHFREDPILLADALGMVRWW
jgi:hypothetical protein